MKSPFFEKKVLAWAMYDWANSAFATTVMVAFFPVFFKQTLAAGVAPTASTVWLGNANGISSLVLALTAPWLGALADKGSAHVRMLAIFTAIGVLPTALLAFVNTSDTLTGLTLFVVASIGFWGGLMTRC
jgi:UMF1 family MFS transporter